jgi:hypothetical protein
LKDSFFTRITVEMLTGSSVLIPGSNWNSDGCNPWYRDENSDTSSHQMGKGHRDHIGLGVADKNSQAGGGLVNYFSGQAAEQ